jgi:hypothetical protein
MATSIRRPLLATLSAAALAAFFAVTLPSPAAVADDAPKNLKILPKTMSKADIKKLMKGVASSLGVQCDHCHDTDAFEKDTEKKEVARKMMTMTGDINQKFFKGEAKVGCITCHNGQKAPKGPPKSK